MSSMGSSRSLWYRGPRRWEIVHYWSIPGLEKLTVTSAPPDTLFPSSSQLRTTNTTIVPRRRRPPPACAERSLDRLPPKPGERLPEAYHAATQGPVTATTTGGERPNGTWMRGEWITGERKLRTVCAHRRRGSPPSRTQATPSKVRRNLSRICALLWPSPRRARRSAPCRRQRSGCRFPVLPPRRCAALRGAAAEAVPPGPHLEPPQCRCTG